MQLLSILSLSFALGSAAAFTADRVFVSTPARNLPKKTVQDCMSPAQHVLKADMTVDQTMNMLLENGLSGAPVVNEKNQVVGIVSSYDLIQREAFAGALLPMDGSVENVERYVSCAQKICGQKVEDVMTINPTTVSSETSMQVAASLMMEKKLHRLPVVDEQSGKLIGMLTSADVMRDLLHIVRNLPAAKDVDANLNP